MVVCSHSIIFELRQNLELEKIIVHNDYNTETTEHDVALLKLRQAVDLAVRRVITIFYHCSQLSKRTLGFERFRKVEEQATIHAKNV